MKYPTREEIDNADRITISRWYRFLPSPGTDHIRKENFVEHCNKESLLMNRINERFDLFGGMTSEISKLIRWKE